MSNTNTWYTGATFRGVDYSPIWTGWVVGPASPPIQTFDSDFANDAFQSLWGKEYQAAPSGDTSVPYNNKENYRNDLQTIRSKGFNLVRLYNWDMARGTSSSDQLSSLDHINFLNYAASLGLKVVVPISDYFLNDTQYSWNSQPISDYNFSRAPTAIQTDFNQFIASITDPTTKNIHSAIHSISVGNEGDIGEGLSSPPTAPSDFLARTIWWIVNLHNQINGSGTGPNGNPVVNGVTPVILLTATFSNSDQGGTTGSWFNCLINGVTANQNTPNSCALGNSFATAVTGLSVIDPNYVNYYYNSENISQVSMASPYGNTLAATIAQYDSGNATWPGAKFNVPLLVMEMFTPNRTDFQQPSDQTTAAIAQVQAMETYLSQNNAGTTSSTTNLMGYCYFEFNDESANNKFTGLYQYGSNFTNAHTGTTSIFYSPYTIPDYTFPVYTLIPTANGTGTLVDAITALFPVTENVDSKQAWKKTGVSVTPGKKVIITRLSGSWTANPNVSNGEMFDAAGNPAYIVPKEHTTYPLAGYAEGALIGRVGDNGTPFFVGNGPTVVPSSQSGELELVINDDLTGALGAGLTDNKGSINVSIQSLASQ